MNEVVDVAVLGGGPGGYATALRAAQRGLKATVIEGDRLGGTCLHRGCVPSKTLLQVAQLADGLPQMTALGLATPGPGLDLGRARSLRDAVIDRLHRGLTHLLERRRVDTIRGWGRVIEPGYVEVESAGRRDVVRARHLVVATGSVPAELPGVVPDGARVLSSDDVLRLDRVPVSAVVVGGGAVGVELSSLWCSLGSRVTLVEACERLLPSEDPSSSSALADAFARRGIDVRTGTALSSVKVGADDVVVELGDGTSIVVEQVLIAAGRRPRTWDVGLAELGVLDGHGAVAADATGRTAVPGVWAVGDVLPTLALAHAAFAEGFVVADAIAGLDPRPVDHRLLPRVTYSSPEVASVGLTEPEARAQHADVDTATVELNGNARALIEGVGGHVKLVHLGDGTLVGGHVVGPSATELVAELGMATTWGALVDEVAEIVHAHPSLSESVREAALAAAGLPFHSPE